jgi:hypothetical protein
MPDLVGTCPKDFWEEWIAEGDAAGEPESGEEWSWYTRDSLAETIRPGDRFYVVAHGRLRGFAPVVRVIVNQGNSVDGIRTWQIIRGGGAVACTIDIPVPGFRGLRRRWWNREDEKPFAEWKNPIGLAEAHPNLFQEPK